MFKNWYFKGNKWEVAKMIMVALCITLIINQISSGIDMIKSNENLPAYVLQQDFDSLTAETEIRGELTHIDGNLYGDDTSQYTEYEEGEIQYYILITESKKIMLIRTNSGSSIDKEIHNLMRGDCQSVSFRGYVRTISDADRSTLNLQLITTNFLKKNGIKGGTQEAMLNYLVDITNEDDKIPQKYITATFVIAGLLFLMIPLLLRKTIKNAYISWAIKKGKIDEKQLLDKNKYVFDNEGMYKSEKNQGNSFYVNTKHNLRDEGALDEVKEELLTHMVAEEDLFYEGGLNDEGNFYVDSTKKVQTLYSDDPDDDNLLKKY